MPSPFDSLPSTLAGGAGVGGGFVFVRWLVTWASGRVDLRQARLDQEHAALDGGWREYRTKLEARIDVLERSGAVRDVQLANMRLAFELVAAELRKADPANTALHRAEQLLVVAFPLEQVVPSNLAAPGTIVALDVLPNSPGRRP